MNFIKHQVADMDESMVQHCIFCGEVISDYRNAVWPAGQSAPQGFPAGPVFVSQGRGNPKIYTRIEPEVEEFKNCS